MKISPWIFTLFLLLCSCFGNHQKQEAILSHSRQEKILYAHGFTITRYENFTVLQVHNPWEGAENIEFKYIVCSKGTIIPDSFKNCRIIYTPVKRIICMSTTHIALLSLLGDIPAIVGFSGLNYVYDSLTQVNIKNNKIVEIGFDQALNYERIVSLKPDIIMAFGVQGESALQYKKLDDMGIPVIMNGDYLEETALGKLEWIKFVAEFFNQSSKAKKKFDEIANEYQQLTSLVKNVTSKPVVMTGIPWKGVWYMPGGKILYGQTYPGCRRKLYV